LILVFKPVNLARLDQVSLDARVLVSALVLCLLAGVLVGVAPALTMARRDLRPSGQAGGRAIAGGLATRRTRRALVVTEFALAVILLSGSGLLLRSLRSVEDVDLGFRPERVLSVSLSTSGFAKPAQRAAFYNRVLEELASHSGVETAGITSELLIGGSPERAITVEGDARPGSHQVQFRSDEVSPGFFEAVGTPLLRGRYFTAADGAGSQRVAIINDAMGRRLWPGRDPVGKRFTLGTGEAVAQWFTVVGVVGDMRRQGLEREPIPQMFEPLAQNPPRFAILLVRTSGDDPLQLAGSIQAAVRAVDKHVPQYGVTTVENQLGGLLAARRFQTSLLTGFSGIALLIAAIGIYGLVQYSVATRTREIGIRIAIGAEAGQVFRMIIAEGMKLSFFGLALGIAGALWVGRFGSSFLFGVTPTDPATFLIVSLLLTAVTTAACYFPARRAMKIEPTSALRQE
jgi:putative ABC transport system permease protein